MSRSIIQPINVVTEIDGIISMGMLAFGMRAVVVQNDDPALILRYFVLEGTEVAEGTTVKEGDILGSPGRFPEMLSIGATKYVFPKSFKINSGGLIKIEQTYYGSDGKFYIARLCSVAILHEDESFDMELGLDSEIVEQELYLADEFVIEGKMVINAVSLYGIREEEILEEEKDLPLIDWLEKKRILGELFYWCPYEQLLWLEIDLSNLTNELEKRIFNRP